jgi:SAM-dependent methyltransferase
MSSWWQTFFDEEYARLWTTYTPPEQTEAEAEVLWNLLELREDSRVLDAPCGYGRFSVQLARRGARVVGVDYSPDLLAKAERERGELGADRLTYLRHDLREPLGESGFDMALNLFSSLGYGTEEDDVRILRTLRNALRPGGRVFVDTMHRDVLVARLSRDVKPSRRLHDGTLFLEEPSFDPIQGRLYNRWYWSGPGGSGSKEAHLRVYCATELVALLERAGLRFASAHAGISAEPFRAEGPSMGGRLGLLAERPPHVESGELQA